MSKIKSSKRILAVLLAIIMAFSVMGIVVSADGEVMAIEPTVEMVGTPTKTVILDCKLREGTTQLLATGFSVLVATTYKVTWADKDGVVQKVEDVVAYDLDPNAYATSEVSGVSKDIVVTLPEYWTSNVKDAIAALTSTGEDGGKIPEKDLLPVTGIGTSDPANRLPWFIYFDEDESAEFSSIYNFTMLKGDIALNENGILYKYWDDDYTGTVATAGEASALSSVIIPASYNLIEDGAFANVPGDKGVLSYLGTCAQWEKVENNLDFDIYEENDKKITRNADGLILVINDKTDHVWHVWKGKEGRTDIEWADDAERYWDEFKYADGNSMHLRYCEICGDEDIKDHTHTYASSKILKDPTCKDTGIIQYICEECGYIYTEVLPIEEDSHRFGDWQYRDDDTCYLKCTLCGYEEVDQHYLLDTYPVYDRNPDGSIKLDANGEPIWHEENNPWVHDADSHGRICWYCGHMVRREHNYKYWEEKTFDAYSTTCIQKWRRCTVCGRKEVYGTVGHDFSGPWKSNEDRSFFQSGSMSRTCTQCGEKSPIKISSKFIAPRDTNGDKVVNELDYVPLYRRLLGTSYIGEIFGVPLGAVLFVVDIILGGVDYLKSVFVPHRPIGL